MKKKFLRYSLSLITKYHPEYDEDKIAEVSYGLEGFYLTITKFIVIMSLALLLDVVYEMLLVLICFNLFRFTGFGLHASKTWVCLVSSAIIFLGMPILVKEIVIAFPIKVILCTAGFILFYLYAPADTKKRPIVNEHRRKFLKHVTLGITVIASMIACFYPSEVISNAILCGMYTEIILILPITYQLFHLSYANYKNYLHIPSSD